MNENSLAVIEDYKIRLNKEGSETVTKCNRLKMIAEDGKSYEKLLIHYKRYILVS